MINNKQFTHCLSKPIKLRQLFNVCVATVRKITPQEPEEGQSDVRDSPLPKRVLSPAKRKDSNFILDPELKSSATQQRTMLPKTLCRNTERSILIAEDLKTNQEVIKGLLAKLGFHDVTVVVDGQEALNKIVTNDFDIIMMDLKMPRVDGFECTRRIRRVYENQRFRPFIIALTANASNGIQDRCAAAGMDAYISKPMDVHELANILNSSCD
jgi:CheY-like chemotaxis protein